MRFKRLSIVVLLAVVAAAVLVADVSYAQEFRTATRLGGSRQFTGPIRDLAAMQKMFSRPRTQKDLGVVMDKAGLSSLTPEVIAIITSNDPSKLKAVDFVAGRTMEWMALRNGGRPDLITRIRWGGKKPFQAWEFFIDDGVKGYTFVVPKPCGNVALAEIGPSPKAMAAEEARRAEEARKAEEARRADEARKAEEARKAAMAPPACSVTASLQPVKGGYNLVIDGSASASAAVPAVAMTAQIIDPLNAPFSFLYNGKPEKELKLSAPFQGTVMLRKAKPGTYTVKVVTARNNNVAPDSNCETTFSVISAEKMRFFVEGDFGKERRQREVEPEVAPAASAEPIINGFCAPLVGLQFGMDYKLSDVVTVAPAIGVAFNLDEGSQTSLFGEVMVNRWFTDGKNFIGAGAGLWDFTHGDTLTGSIGLNLGFELFRDKNDNPGHFVVSGRLFTDGMDEVGSNYQFWGGLRYYFGKR